LSFEARLSSLSFSACHLAVSSATLLQFGKFLFQPLQPVLRRASSPSSAPRARS
jgi:hypothetical protein